MPALSGVVITPLNHVLPTPIGFRNLSDPSVTVGHAVGAIPSKASARLCCSAPKIRVSDNREFSAVAQAKRRSQVADIFRFGNCDKSSKSLTQDADWSRHNDVDSIVVFSRGMPAVTGSHCESRSNLDERQHHARGRIT
jgi:hypothetical protein